LLLQGTSKVNQVFIQDVADHVTSLINKDLCLALSGVQAASWLDIITIMILIIIMITSIIIIIKTLFSS